MYTINEGVHSRIVGRGDQNDHREDWAEQDTAAWPRGPHVTGATLIAWLGRRWAFVAIFMAAGALAGGVVTALVPPRYTASTEILIAPSNLRLVNDDLYAQNQQSDSQILDVESKMRLILSGNVLRRVVAGLDPEARRELAAKPWFAPFGGPADATPSTASLADALAARIKVSRQERSYVVTVSATMGEPEEAAGVAQAVTEAFKNETVQSDADRAGLAARSLTGRLADLKAGVTDADAKVEAFRRGHGLQQGTGGQFVSTQALERIDAKITDARASLAAAQARYKAVDIASRSAGTAADAVTSPVLTTLRTEEATLRRQATSLALDYGPRHPALIDIRAQLGVATRAVQAEVMRLHRAALLDVDEAKTSLNELQDAANVIRGTVDDDDQDQVGLRGLERDASAKAALYKEFLARSGELAERQRVDAIDMRVVSEASPPSRPSFPPRATVTVPAGAALGLAAGAFLVLAWCYAWAWRAAAIGRGAR